MVTYLPECLYPLGDSGVLEEDIPYIAQQFAKTDTKGNFIKYPLISSDFEGLFPKFGE